MHWSDERYVRLYVRDTADWLALSFEAQSLLPLILRKLDRSGRMKLGKHGKRAVAICLGHPGKWDVIGPALEELLSDGCLVIDSDALFAPNFVVAQEATASNAKRCRDYRERVAEDTSDTEDVGPNTKRVVRDTSQHAPTRSDTPSRAVPSLAVPHDLAPRPAASTPPAGGAAPATQLPLGASPFARWLAETWPDVRDPVAFEAAEREANPGVDLLSEARRARAWEIAEPSRKKHRHGKFLHAWFARAQDRPQALQSAPVTRLRPLGAPGA